MKRPVSPISIILRYLTAVAKTLKLAGASELLLKKGELGHGRPRNKKTGAKNLAASSGS
jgi:hypothetical protein